MRVAVIAGLLGAVVACAYQPPPKAANKPYVPRECIIKQPTDYCEATIAHRDTTRREDPYENLVVLESPKIYSGRATEGWVAWLNWTSNKATGKDVTSLVVETYSPRAFYAVNAFLLDGRRVLEAYTEGTPTVGELSVVVLPDDPRSMVGAEPTVSIRLAGLREPPGRRDWRGPWSSAPRDALLVSLLVQVPVGFLEGFLRRVEEERAAQSAVP
jgi:hypothetical protein